MQIHGVAFSGFFGGYLPLPAVYSCAGASALFLSAVAIASLKSYINEKHLAWKDMLFLCEVEQPFAFVNYGTEVPAEGAFHRETELELDFHQSIEERASNDPEISKKKSESPTSDEPFLKMKKSIEAAGDQKKLTQTIEKTLDQFICESLSKATDHKIYFGLISSIRDETGLDSGGKGESQTSTDKMMSIIAPPDTDKPMFIRDLVKHYRTELVLAIRKERLNQSRLG